MAIGTAIGVAVASPSSLLTSPSSGSAGGGRGTGTGTGTGTAGGGGGKRLRVVDVTLSECGGPRQKSRSVSWNSSGAWLASAASDRLAKIWAVDGGGGQGRELHALAGHAAAVERVRFHPADPHLLCTAADDRTVRFWDVRNASGSSSSSSTSSRPGSAGGEISRIDLKASSSKGGGRGLWTCPASVEWHPYVDGGRARYVAVSEKDSGVRVYDQRKLSGGNGATPVRTFHLAPHVLQECHFSPSGTHLVAATRGTEGMGELRVWRWDDGDDLSSSSSTLGGQSFLSSQSVYVGHTGPCYVARFSPDGTRLATGGADALVGLWDVETMTCVRTTASSSSGARKKFVRSVAFSHDSRLVASCSEEDGVDVSDAETGESAVALAGSNPGGGAQVVSLVNKDAPRRFGQRHYGGADELAWHPKAYVLACARGDASSAVGGSSSQSSASGAAQSGAPTESYTDHAQVTVAKLGVVSC